MNNTIMLHSVDDAMSSKESGVTAASTIASLLLGSVCSQNFQGDVRFSVSFSFLYFLKSAARPVSKSCFICSASCLSTCTMITDQNARQSFEENTDDFTRATAQNADRLADAFDDAFRDQREHRREVEPDAHLDVPLEALLALPLRVQRAADGQGEVRRHGIAVQAVQLVVRLRTARQGYGTYIHDSCFRRLNLMEMRKESSIYHFHQEEAGGVDGHVGRVLLPVGLADEAHDDHRRCRQEEELDGEELNAPLFL